VLRISGALKLDFSASSGTGDWAWSKTMVIWNFFGVNTTKAQDYFNPLTLFLLSPLLLFSLSLPHSIQAYT